MRLRACPNCEFLRFSTQTGRNKLFGYSCTGLKVVIRQVPEQNQIISKGGKKLVLFQWTLQGLTNTDKNYDLRIIQTNSQGISIRISTYSTKSAYKLTNFHTQKWLRQLMAATLDALLCMATKRHMHWLDNLSISVGGFSFSSAI